MTKVMNSIIDRYRKLTPGTRKFFACLISLAIALCTMQMVMRPVFALSNDEDMSETAPGESEEPATPDTGSNEPGTEPDTITKEPSEPVDTAGTDNKEPGAPETTPEVTPQTTPETTPEATPEPTASAEPSAEPEEPKPAEEPEETTPETPEDGDPEADTETDADWERMFESVEWTGVWADDVITAAELQIGYRESEANFILDEAGNPHGYTRYGAWYGDPYAKWDSMFVLFTLHYAGLTTDDIPVQADCDAWVTALKEADMFRGNEDYVPAKGDLVFADMDEDGTADHVGFVKAVNSNETGEPEEIVVIEGDTGHEVKENTYPIHNAVIVGYGQLPENPALSEPSVYTLTGSANRVEVTVEYEKGAFPDGTTMEVKTVGDRKVIEAINETVTEENKEVVRVQAVDIIFRTPEGTEIEPEKPIKVTMKSLSVPKATADKPVVVHMDAQEGPQVIETDEEQTMETVRFEAGSFSVYAIVYTLETYYTSYDGASFRITLGYTSEAELPEGSKLDVQEISSDSEEYEEYLRTARDQLETEDLSITGSRFFDIRIMNGEDEVEPKAPVTVKIELDEMPEETDRISVLHFQDDEAEAIEDVESDSTSIQFAADSFSPYGVISLRAAGDPFFAVKIGVTEFQDDDNVVLYKTLYNSATGVYEDYVIDGNGNLVRAYDKSDRIVGLSAVSTVWKAIVHSESAGYYDFYNEQTGKYLTPMPGAIVSETRLGVTLDGRRDGKNNSVIAAWDNSSMSYYGYRITESGGSFSLESVLKPQAQEISFAKVVESTPGFHKVDTIDSVAAGITIHMFDYPSANAIKNVTEGEAYVAYTLPSVHIKDTLTNGYPTFSNGNSGETLFQPSGPYYKGKGNKLFLKSVYNATGYYEYNAFNNFAHYDTNTYEFTVYQELMTPISNNAALYYKRGNFLPYNSMQKAKVATNKNLYDGNGKELPEDDPTKGSILYVPTEAVDYYYGMTVEASFMQPRDGKQNGGPVVYEFNGDDDLWIFIDNVRVLDIGGIHDAWPGTINFATGAITYPPADANHHYTKPNNRPTTIKQAFQEAGVFPDGTAWDDSKVNEYFKDYTFVDYGSHTFKMFYMESGAGASNLEMRFNLPVIEKGKFTVEKELTGTNKEAYSNVEFAYQAFKKEEGADVPLAEAVYEGTADPVTFHNGVEIDGKTYDNVFYLKPGEAATFAEMPENTEYYVQELGVDTDHYDEVYINDVKVEGQDNIYPSGTATVVNRARVTYTNHCSEKNKNELRITKQLDPDSMDFGTLFEFRVLLENKAGALVPYYQGPYCIQNEEGDYFLYEDGKLINNGKTHVIASYSGNNGTILIPAGYTIVIEELLEGTDFYVEEIRLPDGWALYNKTVKEGTCDPSDKQGKDWAEEDITADGQIRLNTAAEEVFTNRGAQKIIVQKEWKGSRFVTTHGDIHVALFETAEDGSLTLVEDTVKTISAPAVSVEYNVPDASIYVAREVVVNGEDVTPVEPNGTIEVTGETTEDKADDTNEYTVTYKQGELKPEEGQEKAVTYVRTDTVTNTCIPKTASLTVRKSYSDGNDRHPRESVEVTLYKVVEGTETAAGTAVFGASNSWNYTWKNLPLIDAEGRKITYMIKETRGGEGYTVSYAPGNTVQLEADKTSELTVFNTPPDDHKKTPTPFIPVPGRPIVPNTSDIFHPELWIGVLAASLIAGICALVVLARNR